MLVLDLWGDLNGAICGGLDCGGSIDSDRKWYERERWDIYM